MSETNKTYRIRTNLKQDTHLNLNLNQDFDTIEVLSLKVNKEPFYKLHTANYGCLVGRVVANGNFGIPNAKVSVFIAQNNENNEDSILSYLYPYKDTFTKDENGIRYNLLTEDKINDCHQNVGTFPSKRRVLDDNNVLEVFDTYYKFTTTTNEAGDYMIFGVPTGIQTIHVDIDLSDIGILSQKPRDMLYKGYNETQFDSAEQFKKDTNIDNLAQIISQNSSVQVYPFWGEENEGDEVKITRRDIDINYKFEPTCIFMGSVITDERSNGISEKCIATDNTGLMESLTTGKGTIEMIRKKVDGTVESFSILGNQLIDGDGVWCYQIPMNLDYMSTDEFGNLVPSEDTEHGIPTRARVRFRLSMGDDGSDNDYSHYAKVLVPNNPKDTSEIDYVFGSKTKDDENGTESFRDLFWNNIYSVKSFIPRIQKGNYQRNKKFTGIKRVNVYGSNNPIPYNNMRVDITFMFTLQCAILKMLIRFASFFNSFLSLIYSFSSCGEKGRRDKWRCVTVGDGACPDLENWYFAPGCWRNTLMTQTYDNLEKELDINFTEENGYEDGDKDLYGIGNSYDEESIDTKNSNKENKKTFCITRQMLYFMQCIEVNLAMEHNVIQFDFYNDWMNGMIYIPRWFANIKKKRTYLFGLFKTKEKVKGCTEEYFKDVRRYTQQCAIEYEKNPKDNNLYTSIKTRFGCSSDDKKFHCNKSVGRRHFPIFGKNGGIVHREENMDKKNIFYFKPIETNGNKRIQLYATDIILLGSFDNCNNGIPVIIDSLPTSSFKLPPNIAHTNQDSNGILYGTDDNDNYCGSNHHKWITHDKYVDDSGFTNYEKWQKYKDYGEDPETFKKYQSVTEYPVTEIAGIDWGLSGPLQGKKNNSYTPGGHFLGISCSASEVSIKSCINLQRICELGVRESTRFAHIQPVNNEYYKYAYFTPMGIISRDEINDGNIRSVFASLNNEALETVIIDGVRQYKINGVYPVNFDGVLSSKIKSIDSDYYNNSRTINGNAEYKRLLEATSYDYYKFRLGEKGEEVFLNNSNGVYSLPQYRNSFYFYFGLHNGSTALDKFNEKFFAKCPVEDEEDKVYNINSNGGINFCDKKLELSISTENFILPIEVQVMINKDYKGYLKYVSGNTYEIEYISQNSKKEEIVIPLVHHSNFVIKNDNINVGDELDLTFFDKRNNIVNHTIKVDMMDLPFITPIKIESYNFNKELIIENYDSNRKILKGDFKKISQRNGCSIIKELDIWESDDTETTCGIRSAILIGEKYYYCIGSGLTAEEKTSLLLNNKSEIEKFQNISGETIELKQDKVNKLYELCLWEGNQDMTLTLLYKNSLGHSGITNMNIFVSMPTNLDFYFYDSHLLGKELEKIPVYDYKLDISQDKWWENIDNESITSLTAEERWCLEKCCFYQQTVFNKLNNDTIKVGVIGGIAPYTTTLTGNEEIIGDYLEVKFDTDYISKILTENKFRIPLNYYGEYRVQAVYNDTEAIDMLHEYDLIDVDTYIDWIYYDIAKNKIFYIKDSNE